MLFKRKIVTKVTNEELKKYEILQESNGESSFYVGLEKNMNLEKDKAYKVKIDGRTVPLKYEQTDQGIDTFDLSYGKQVGNKRFFVTIVIFTNALINAEGLVYTPEHTAISFQNIIPSELDDMTIIAEELKKLDSDFFPESIENITVGSRMDGENIGKNSSTFGNSITASGNYSHAEGRGTKASGDCSHVQGKYNIEDTENKYANIVGNGESTYKRLNIHTLDWEGNAWYSNEVYVGGKNKDEGKKLLSTKDIYFNSNGVLVITINGITKTFVPKSE